MTYREGHEAHELLPEEWLEKVAASFNYPPTPDVAGRVRRRLARPRPVAASSSRRLAWAALAVLLLLASLLAVPQVRAALGEILRIGAMTVFVEEQAAGPVATATSQATEPAPTTSVAPTATAALAATSSSTAPAGAAHTEPSLVVPATPVSLAAAREMVDAPLRLPAYPGDLGLPDGVYVDRRERPGVVVLVWDEAQLSLYQIQQANFGYKTAQQVAETTVNGRRAVWIESPHHFQLANGSFRPWQFVPGPVLLWTEGSVTYRLEGAVSLEEAVRIGESLERLGE